MENDVYEIESPTEERHWWFVVRRELFKSYLNKFKLDSNAKILDIGSASGGNLRLLKNLGFKNYLGFDINPLSKKFIEKKNLGNVVIGDICKNNFPDNNFDAILATDVIEHIADDNLALKEMRRIIKDDGKIIITAPCFGVLWNKHDDMNMHYRRYKIKDLRAIIQKNNFEIVESYYFNFLLFIPILFFRKITKIFKLKIRNDISVNNNFFNFIFKIIFFIDIKISKFLKPPFGVSALIICVPKKIIK